MRFFTLLIMALLVLPVQATTKMDIFSVEVLLDANDSNAEQLARSQGLKQVIIRASGKKDADQNEVIKKALKSSSKYLSQIGYGEHNGNQTLKMVFSSAQIQSLLAQAQLPYWSDERANLAVWVVENNRQGREILWENSESPFINQVYYYANLRGLPITIPVGDFEDVTGIAPTDLWGGFLEPISNVTKRYPVDAVLIMRVQKMGTRDGIRWTLLDAKPETLTSSAVQPLTGSQIAPSAQALEMVIDEITNHFAKKSSVKRTGESSGAVSVDFVGISDAASFFALEKHLKQMQSVASVDVDKIAGDRVTFRVNLLASDAEFESEVTQNRNIRKVEREFIEEAPQLKVTPSENVENGLQQDETGANNVIDTDTEASSFSERSIAEITGSDSNLIFEWLN